jgi:general secretion pathway protein L
MNNFFPPFARRRPTPPEATGSPLLRPPDGVHYVPGERVLLLSVTLPKMTASQRRAAAVYAVEDRIAQPLEEVHVALGPEMAPNQWLVAVIACSDLPQVTPSHRLLPDTLALPIPPEGAWSVVEEASRILIRRPDGTGLVTRAAALTVLHNFAGTPKITLYAGQIALNHTTAPMLPVALPSRFDLTDRRSHSLTLPPLARRLLAVAAVTALAQLGLLTTDVITLSRDQDRLAAQLRDAAGTTADTPIDPLLTRILSPQTAVPQDAFLPLISASFAALTADPGSISLRELTYSGDTGSLTLTLLAPDLASLQHVESDLAGQLKVTAGPATSANGTAEQQLTLQGSGS